MVSPLSLCILRLLFHLCDFCFHRFYQLCELFLAFLSCPCVHILGYAFAVDSRCEPSFIEMVVYHRHASRATLSYLRSVRIKNRLCGVFGWWLGFFNLDFGRSGISAGDRPLSLFLFLAFSPRAFSLTTAMQLLRSDIFLLCQSSLYYTVLISSLFTDSGASIGLYLFTPKQKYRMWNSHTPPRMAQGI